MRLAMLACLTATCLISTPVAAWKPTSHAYFADVAAQDALDDGYISIPNLKTDQLLTYPVDPQALEALRAAQPHYRAGVLGPDAYPDILTGQQVIHPVPEESGVAGGSNAWLQQVWNGFGNTPQERAFRLGFVTHAAGDMYGHSFINYFTGGNFTFSPLDNAIRHVLLEGYIDRRLPKDAMSGSFFDASISGIEERIYQVMIRADPGSALENALLPYSIGARYSVPRIFSTLRNELDAEIGAYYQVKADLAQRADACSLTNFRCSKWALKAKLAAHVTTNGIQVTFKEAWRDDIDEGLRAWPAVSHSVAVALFFNSGRATRVVDAEARLSEFLRDHILSMTGVPDAVGATVGAAGAIAEAVTPDFLLEPIRQLKADMLDALLVGAIGINKRDLEKYLTSPDRYFDQVMGAGSGGVRTSLADFNANYLRIRDPGYADMNESFDYRQLPAAYNTVIMSKLIYLAPSTINQLLADLGSRQRLNSPNVMLGFVQSLDGAGQWRDGMVLARDCAAYRQILKALPGTGSCDGAVEQVAAPAFVGMAVYFDRGSYVEIGNGRWVEKDAAGNVVFSFEESGRFPGEIKLWDAGRKVHLSLNLNGLMVWYAPDGSPLTPIYPITGVR